MEERQIPKPGEIYQHFKDRPYQIITVATHTETKEKMVVYQALYGDFKTYVRPLGMFVSEVDHEQYPQVIQNYRFELRNTQEQATRVPTPADIVPADVSYSEGDAPMMDSINEAQSNPNPAGDNIETTADGEVNQLLMKFLDAETFSKKLEILTSNIKHLNDRLINDMAVALDCAVDEGPLDQRINGLIFCLQAMCRFENRRLR